MPPEPCEKCAVADQLHWWGDAQITHCRVCHRTWRRASREAHCMGCHRHFSSPSVFDAHFGRAGEHRDPQRKNRTYRQRDDGTWQGIDPRFPSALSPGAQTATGTPKGYTGTQEAF